MKKLLLILWFCALVLGLYAQNDTRRNNLGSLSERISHVSATEAQEVGYTFMRLSNTTRGGSLRQQNMQLIYTGAAADGTDCYYVFALQPTGFVIVSADERVKPILGYSYTNNFVVEDMPINVISWLDNYKKQIKAVVDNNYPADVETKTTWIRLKAGQSITARSGNSVDPLLQTTWNQNCYYNQFCPIDSSGPCNRVYAGCVATAMAQVMHYWEWPTQGFNSHSYTCDYGTLSVDFSTATYNHNNMTNVVNYSTSAAQKEEVARLIYHCGVAVDMDYGPDGSGAYSSDVPAALYNYFAYTDNGSYVYKSSYTETNWANLIKQELDNLRPVYYSGHGSGGHAFVCDGYDENGLFHFNWGWSGSNDGYFELSTLNPSTHDFSDSQAAIIGVKSAGTFMRCSDTELSFSARVGEQSAPQTIMVCGHGLSGNISVSVGSGFKVSKNGSYYYTSLTLPASGGKLYVKYIPTQAGDVSDSLTLTSGNYSLTVSLYGTDKVIVGFGTANNSYLPSYNFYKYSLTQQIYTAEEIGMAGTITSIAFKNTGAEKTRTYNVYMLPTDKETFSGGDWVAMSDDDLVFSGSLTFTVGEWTTIDLDVPFAYDGSSNLLVGVADVTGSYSSSPHMACLVYDATGQALRASRDSEAYDITAPGVTGTVLNVKNQIHLDITPSGTAVCYRPTTLAVSDITHNEATLTVRGGSGTYNVQYKAATATVWTDVATNTTDTTFTIIGLNSLTAYNVQVQSVCEGGVTSDMKTANFSTSAMAEAVGDAWNDDFEGNACGWELVNGTLTNHWVWGNDTNNGGTHALYIANDAADTLGYANGQTKVFATKLLNFTQGKFEFTYDWLCNGESNYDFLRVALVPASQAQTLTAGTDHTTIGTTSLPAGWIALDGGSKLNLQTTWQTSTEAVNVTAGNYYMVLAWRNDGSVCNQPPAAVDNVSITRIACEYDVTGLAVDDITSSSATLAWNDSEATQWQVAYSANASFENATEVIVSDTTYTMTGLQPATTYYARVRAYCGSEDFGAWSTAINFPTTILCPAPTGFAVTEDGLSAYTATLNWTGTSESYIVSYRTAAYTDGLGEGFGTSLPTGWENKVGLLSDVLEGTALTTSSQWFFGNSNGVFDQHARINIYGSASSERHGWLISPAFTVLENAASLTFDLALTAYSGTNVPAPATTGTDDKFVVLISTDDEATWTILRQWDNEEGATYVYNDINSTATGEHVSIDLSSYAGQSVRIAFYGESTVSNADNNLHIDNVHCGIDHETGQWQTATVDAAPAFLSGLIPETAYDAKLQGNCGDDGLSEETGIITFTTLNTCPVPTILTVVDSLLTATAAGLNWHGSIDVDNYTVRYRVPEHIEGGIYETFEATSIPSGWTMYTGLLDTVMVRPSALTPATYGWAFGANNGVFDSHARVNIYSNYQRWLVTPAFTLSGETFTFDMALTKYSGTLQPVVDSLQQDDKFIVLISTDNMTTWTILREWNNSGSDYVYNTIATEGEDVSIDLSAYVGQKVCIAFYGESTNPTGMANTGGDNNLHIDNVIIGNPVVIPDSEWQTAEANTTNVVLTGLTPETTYEAQVKSTCSDPEEWSNTVTFTTPEQTVLSQVIALNDGTTWVSFNVEITLNNLKAALVAAAPGTTIKISGQSNSTTYNPNNGRWSGSLTWDLSKMYKIKATECEITLEGMPINPADHPVTIVNANNYLGFPLDQTMTLDAAFAEFAVNGDKVLSQTGSATYTRGRWQGSTLTELQPGKGYVYKSNASESRTFVFPVSAR